MLDRANTNLPTALPHEQQMDAAIFTAATATAAKLPNLHAFLVLRNGHLIHEFYAVGNTRESTHQIRSVTKSVLSALVGIAVERGIIDRLDRPVIDYLPGLALADSDLRLAQITIEHLLTMTAGFAWDEGDDDAVSDWFFSGNRTSLQDAVTRPIVHEPGTVFNYDSPSADLLATLLARVLGRDLRSFADEHLFLPLGIQTVAWEQDPAGNYRGSAGLELRAIDLAKIGQLYLQRGQWQGQQILPKTWVEQSTMTQAVVNPGYGYGYLWWVQEQEPPHFYSAVGYGGQFILVAPAEQIVVVANHEWWEIDSATAGKQSTDFYGEVFAPVLASVDTSDS